VTLGNLEDHQGGDATKALKFMGSFGIILEVVANDIRGPVWGVSSPARLAAFEGHGSSGLAGARQGAAQTTLNPGIQVGGIIDDVPAELAELWPPTDAGQLAERADRAGQALGADVISGAGAVKKCYCAHGSLTYQGET
jgi:hypothetical protein